MRPVYTVDMTRYPLGSYRLHEVGKVVRYRLVFGRARLALQLAAWGCEQPGKDSL